MIQVPTLFPELLFFYPLLPPVVSSAIQSLIAQQEYEIKKLSKRQNEEMQILKREKESHLQTLHSYCSQYYFLG